MHNSLLFNKETIFPLLVKSILLYTPPLFFANLIPVKVYPYKTDFFPFISKHKIYKKLAGLKYIHIKLIFFLLYQNIKYIKN